MGAFWLRENLSFAYDEFIKMNNGKMEKWEKFFKGGDWHEYRFLLNVKSGEYNELFFATYLNKFKNPLKIYNSLKYNPSSVINKSFLSAGLTLRRLFIHDVTSKFPSTFSHESCFYPRNENSQCCNRVCVSPRLICLASLQRLLPVMVF